MSKNRRKRQKQQQPSRKKIVPPKTKSQNPTPTTLSNVSLPPQNINLILFLVNVILAFGWQLFVPLFGSFDYLLGFVLGLIAITIFNRQYGWQAYRLAFFVGYVLWQIVLSNISLAKIVLQPKPALDPGIIAIPLTASTEMEITILASVITLTPGTLSVDLGIDDEGQRVLYVHNLTVGNPAEFQRNIKEGFEHLLLQVTRGANYGTLSV